MIPSVGAMMFGGRYGRWVGCSDDHLRKLAGSEPAIPHLRTERGFLYLSRHVEIIHAALVARGYPHRPLKDVLADLPAIEAEAVAQGQLIQAPKGQPAHAGV